MSDRHRRGMTATAVVEATVEERVDESAPDGAVLDTHGPNVLRPTDDALYPVALLKIAMAMRKLEPTETRHFEILLDTVLEDMVVDRDEFKRYVQRNMSRLVTAVRDGEY